MKKNSSFSFKVISKDSKTKARVGQIHTPHGDIETPAFVAVGTQATVKGLSPDELREIGVELLFGNTYHLHLRPGEDVVQEFGGFGKFMNWYGPTITDSGGFQVFSLAKRIAARGGGFLTHASGDVRQPFEKIINFFPSSLSESRPPDENTQKNTRPTFSSPGNDQESSIDKNPSLVKITNDKVVFRSHIDGSLHELTPELSIQIQKKLGADIILCFDECAPYPSTREYTKEAMERTHKWAERSLAEFYRCHPELLPVSRQGVSVSTSAGEEMPKQVRHDTGREQALYGIVQGGVCKDFREESAKFISSLPFDGIAIGGVSVGETKKEMRDVLSWVHPFLPEEKPRHLLGIGEIDDIFSAIECGMDTFDCVIPTRFGRYGIVFVPPWESEAKGRFRLDINRSIYVRSNQPLSKDCECKVCKQFTRGYVNHVFKANELLAYRLASYHNMYFIVHLVKKIREAIMEGEFSKMKKEWVW